MSENDTFEISAIIILANIIILVTIGACYYDILDKIDNLPQRYCHNETIGSEKYICHFEVESVNNTLINSTKVCNPYLEVKEVCEIR